MTGWMRGRGWLGTAMCLAALGCHHKQPVAAVPAPPPANVPLMTAHNTPLVAQVPAEPTPMPEVIPPKKVRKPRKKPVVPTPLAAAAPPPVEVASAGPPPPPGAVIGALTAEGDASPEKKQRASQMIVDLDKRISGMSANGSQEQRNGIVRVRNFEREARKALDSGDAEGAITLATKAKLLLDDLLK